MTGRYDKNATVLSLAWTSYINNGMEASPEELRRHAEQDVPKILSDPKVTAEIGQWDLLWGPVVNTQSQTCDNRCYSDNTMFLVKGKDPDHPEKDMLVLAIAGTNFSSLFDWGTEDFDVTTMVEWPNASADASFFSYFSTPTTTQDPNVSQTGNYISAGINVGVNILLNEMTYEGKTVVEYLKDNFGEMDDSMELAVTGHSLGGGLSPVLALALKDGQGYWNPKGKFQLTTYPFAGQSPGNGPFASYFFTRIPTEDFHGHYNSLDVVPKGFATETLNEVQNLYAKIDPHLANQCVIGEVIHCVKPAVEPFQYTSLYSAENQFTYETTYSDTTYQEALDDYSEQCSDICYAVIKYACGILGDASEAYARTINFSSMAEVQHLQAYIDAFNIQTIDQVIKSYQAPGPYPDFFSLYCKTPLLASCPGQDSYCELP